MIYLDTSVALAHLLAEDKHPRDGLWSEVLVSSRLLEYELWTRLHARKLARTHTAAAQDLLARVALLELLSEVLDRVREPFPKPVRTLDALHLATMWFLREHDQDIVLASYDERMIACAQALGFTIHHVS